MTPLKTSILLSLSLLSLNIYASPLLETTITTATRSESLLKDTTASISVLSKEELTLLNPVHIHEVLQGLAGVNMHRGSGQESLNAIRSPVLTGAGACGAFLNTEDGIPLRAAGFCNLNELFEAHTEQAERIEVSKGSVSALYGSNALHGMVNTVLPAIAPKEIGVELGSDQYTRLKTSWHWQQGAQTTSVLFTGTQDDGFRDETGYDQQKLSVRYQHELDRGLLSAGLTVTNLNQETAGFIQGLDAYKDETLSRSNPTPEAFRDAQSIRAWLRFEQTINERQQVVITPYFRRTSMDFLQHFLPGDPLEENGQHSAGIQSGHYYSLGKGGNNGQLITGIDVEFTDAYLRQRQDAPTQGSAFLVATVPVGQHYNYDVKASIVAPFIQVDYTLSQYWSLDAGVRYEQSRYEYDNKLPDGRSRDDGSLCSFGGCRYSRPADSTDTFDNTSLQLAVMYEPGEQRQVYAKVSQAFRAPQATELYRLQRDQNKARLDSVQLKGIELGLKGQWASTTYAMAVYYQQKDNVIFRDSDFFNQSNGQSTHQGLELSLSQRLGDTLTASINATYAKHQYDNHQLLNGIDIYGNDVDTAPRTFGQAKLQYAYKEDAQVSVSVQYMGDYYLDPENLHEYDGHSIVNMHWSQALKKGFRLTAHIENVLDKAYAARADFTSFTNERYFPGRPRSVYFGLTKTF